MTVYSIRKGFLKPLAFGVRRVRGVWPPSNPGLMVSRVPWPFVPVPAVFPRRPPIPRATRCFLAWEPGAGLRSWTFMELLLLERHQVGDPGQHPPDLGPVGQHRRRADPAQPEGPDRAPVLGLRADQRLDQGHLELAGHHWTSTTGRSRRLRSV